MDDRGRQSPNETRNTVCIERNKQQHHAEQKLQRLLQRASHTSRHALDTGTSIPKHWESRATSESIVATARGYSASGLGLCDMSLAARPAELQRSGNFGTGPANAPHSMAFKPFVRPRLLACQPKRLGLQARRSCLEWLASRHQLTRRCSPRGIKGTSGGLGRSSERIWLSPSYHVSACQVAFLQEQAPRPHDPSQEGFGCRTSWRLTSLAP